MSPWAIAAFVVVVAAIVFVAWYFSADQRLRRAIKALPITRIAHANGDCTVRLVGTVEVAQPILSPLSGRPCAYWQVRVQQRRSSGRNNTTWTTIVNDHGGTNFTVRDETGLAEVDMTYANPLLDKDRTLNSGFLNDAPPHLEAYLNSKGNSSEGWIFNKTLRYYEGIIEPGEKVTVVGKSRLTARATAYRGYATGSPEASLSLTSPDDGSPLLLSDEPKLLS